MKSNLYSVRVWIDFAIISILCAILVYPALHETGHYLSSVFVRAQNSELSLFPIPYTVCNIENISFSKIVLIAASGMIFPIVVTLFIPEKNIHLWFFKLVIKLISLIAFAISSVSTIFNLNTQDDMLTVVNMMEKYQWIVSMASVCLCALTAVNICNNKILRKLLAVIFNDSESE